MTIFSFLLQYIALTNEVLQAKVENDMRMTSLSVYQEYECRECISI